MPTLASKRSSRLHTTTVPPERIGRITFTLPAPSGGMQAVVTAFYDVSLDDYQYDYEIEAVDEVTANELATLIDHPITFHDRTYPTRTHPHLSALMSILQQERGATVEAAPFYKPPGAVF